MKTHSHTTVMRKLVAGILTRLLVTVTGDLGGQRRTQQDAAEDSHCCRSPRSSNCVPLCHLFLQTVARRLPLSLS